MMRVLRLYNYYDLCSLYAHIHDNKQNNFWELYLSFSNLISLVPECFIEMVYLEFPLILWGWIKSRILISAPQNFIGMKDSVIILSNIHEN